MNWGPLSGTICWVSPHRAKNPSNLYLTFSEVVRDIEKNFNPFGREIYQKKIRSVPKRSHKINVYAFP